MGTATTNKLNDLLRGYISAAETYKQAIDKVADANTFQPQVHQLEAIQRDHGTAAQRVRSIIEREGAEADDSSGAWGAWAKTVEGAATLFGDKSALKALKEGEEHGLKQIREIVQDQDVDPAARTGISDLASLQERHIRELDAMIQNA